MLVFTVRFAQQAAVICKMDVSCIATQQIVYQPVDIPSSVSKSGIKCVLRLQSLAYASTLYNWALGKGVCIYTYPGGTVLISEFGALPISAGGASGIPGGWGAGCDGCAPIHFRIQRACGFSAVLSSRGRLPSIWFSWTIAGCLSIAALSWAFPENSTPHVLSSLTSARGSSIRHWVSSITAHKNPPVAILAIFQARRMSDCSSCSWPSCLAIVADMLKTYKKLIATSKIEIPRLPQPHMTPSPPLGSTMPVSSALGEVYHENHPRKCKSWLSHDVSFRGHCELMPWSTMVISHYGQRWTGHRAHYIHQLYIISLVDGHLPLHRSTYIWLRAASYSCCLPSIVPRSNVHPGHTCSGCICSVAVDQLGSALLLWLSGWCNGWRACRSARFVSSHTWLRSLWSHDSLVCKRGRRW